MYRDATRLGLHLWQVRDIPADDFYEELAYRDTEAAAGFGRQERYS